LAEQAGADVNWDGNLRKIDVIMGENSFVLKENDDFFIHRNRAMADLTFIAERLDLLVGSWNESDMEYYLTSR